MKNAAILGASGYTGAEAVRLVAGHPKLKLAALTAYSRAGENYADVYPNFAHLDLPPLQKIEDVDWEGVDVAFACLPHGASQEVIAGLYDKVETIIDLSADFRLSDPALYEDTYGRPHTFTEILKDRVYGLTEFAREDLSGAKLVACPGCYPTCSLLALLPGIQAGLITLDGIIIDAKSGVTGAGRKVAANLLFSELSDGAHAYAVGNHRHAPEIEQGLAQIGGQDVPVSFTPHLIPMNRGMIATCYVQLNEGASVDDLRAAYQSRYENDQFVIVEAEGTVPQTRHVRGGNYARIGIFADRIAGRAIIISVIDNLVKGSSGQAVQNYNLTQGWDEGLGLTAPPLFP